MVKTAGLRVSVFSLGWVEVVRYLKGLQEHIKSRKKVRPLTSRASSSAALPRQARRMASMRDDATDKRNRLLSNVVSDRRIP